MVALKYYAPFDPIRHAALASTPSQLAPPQATRSLHWDEKRTTWVGIERKVSTRSAPTEGNRRWSLAKLSSRRHSESPETERKRLSRNVVKQRQQESQPLSPKHRGRPALFVTIPEEDRSASRNNRVCMEESILDASAQYSPVAASPFVSHCSSEDAQAALDIARSSSSSRYRDAVSRESEWQASSSRYNHHRTISTQSHAPGTRPISAQSSAPMQQIDITTRTLCSDRSLGSHDDPIPISNKPLPPLPPLPVEEQPSGPSRPASTIDTMSSGEDRFTLEDSIAVALCEEERVLPFEEKRVLRFPTAATLSGPFSTFDPSAFMADDSETDSDDEASVGSSVDPPSLCSTPDTWVAEPPPIPQRSDKRPSMPLLTHCSALVDESIASLDCITHRPGSIFPQRSSGEGQPLRGRNTGSLQLVDNQLVYGGELPDCAIGQNIVEYTTRVARIAAQVTDAAGQVRQGLPQQHLNAEGCRRSIAASYHTPLASSREMAADNDTSESDFEAAERDLVAQLASVASTIDGIRASIVRRSSVRVAEGPLGITVAVA